MNQKKIGVILSYGQIMVTILSSLLYTPIMLRILGAAEYGVYSLSSSIIGCLALLYTSMTSTYMRYYSIYKTDGNQENIAKLNGMFLLIFSILAIIVLILGISVSCNVDIVLGDGLNANEKALAKILFIIMSINMAVLMIKTVFATIVISQERFVFIKTLGIATAVASPLINLPLLYMGFGSIGMSWVVLFLSIVDLLINAVYLAKKLHCKFCLMNLPFKLLPEMAWFSVFIILQGIMDQFNWNLAKLLLSYVADSKAIGIYSVGLQINSLYITMSSAFCGVVVPQIYRLVRENKLLELTALWIKVGRCQFYIMFFIWSTFLFWGKSFIRLWAGAEYDDAYYIALIFITPLVIYLCQHMGIEVLRAFNKHRQWVIVHFVFSLGGFALAVPLSKLYGGIGVAIGTAINTFLCVTFYDNWYFYKAGKLRIMDFAKDFIKFVPACIIIAVLGILLEQVLVTDTWFRFVTAVLIFSILYSVTMYKMAMNEYEKNQIKTILMKFHT